MRPLGSKLEIGRPLYPFRHDGSTFTAKWRLALVSKVILPYNGEDQGVLSMAKLTVTARGQVTFRKEVMRHLGVKPGGKIELDLLPDGQGLVRAARRTGKIEDFFGVLAGKTKKVATLEEINDAIERGWAGQVRVGKK
jgi:bifunctional DNA-binding transcriptional regulator/antitoxin component of YhaV-PrlF toxin-antitoxin module